jgi:hypothetical protein
VTAIANALFVKRVNSAPKGRAMPLPYDAVPDATFKAILLELLLLGFDRIPSTQQQAVAGDASSAAIIGKLLWAGPANAVQGTPIKVIDVAYKWRGDSRPYDEVKTANGFATKANSDSYATAKNMRATWHPFSDEGTRSYLWYRKAATDNCLYNTISVGKNNQWRTYLAYPLIKLSGGRVTGVRGYQGKKKLKVREVGMYGPGSSRGAELELPVSVTYLYMFVMAGLALDTGAMQGLESYPEIGVNNIPFRNVYGSIKCIRVHLGEEASVTDDDGVIVRLLRDKVSDDNHKSIQASFGVALFEQMKAAYEAVLREEIVGVRWRASGAGYEEFSRPFDREFKVGGKTYTLAEVPTL